VTRPLPLSLTLVVSLAIALLTSSRSTVTAQTEMRYRADTGVVTLGQDQILRVTVNGGSGSDAIGVRFRRSRYTQTACADGVCKFAVESQATSPPMISAPNQSSKLDVMGNQIGTDAAARVEVLSSSPNVQVTVQIIDALTGQVASARVAVTSSESTVRASKRARIVADTGVVTPGPNQTLRLFVFDDTDGAETVAFRRISYSQDVCSGGICNAAVSSESQTANVTILPGEAALFDMIDPSARVKVLSSSRNVKVNASLVNSVAGEVTAIQMSMQRENQ